jgi:hypothetical protein
MGKGLRASALPTALAPPGVPKCLASLPYVLTHPRGILCSATRTPLWNSEHTSSATRSNSKSTASPSRKHCIRSPSATIAGHADELTSRDAARTTSRTGARSFGRNTRYTFGPPSVSHQARFRVPKADGTDRYDNASTRSPHHRELEPTRLGERDSFPIARVGVAHDAGPRIGVQHPL